MNQGEVDKLVDGHRKATFYSHNMCFSDALVHMKCGAKVARAGWNGKGMWIALGTGTAGLKAENFWNRHTRAFAEAMGGKADVLPYFIMKTADNKILMGWLASQTDLAAEDWVLLPDDYHGILPAVA